MGAWIIGIKLAEEILRAYLNARFSTDEEFRRRVRKLALIPMEGKPANKSACNPSGFPLEFGRFLARSRYRNMRLIDTPATRSTQASILCMFDVGKSFPQEFKGFLHPISVSMAVTDSG
jgi:hypothetical protein